MIKQKFFTRKDYEHLNPYDSLKYDKRSFMELYTDFLLEDHSIYNLLYNDSIIEPLWLRVMNFITELNINFTMSALFFSDDYIESRISLPKNVRVIFFDFFFNFFNNFN